MIIDKIENLELYCVNDKLKKACSFIKNHDLSKEEIGVHKLEGEPFFYIVSEYKTREVEEAKWESHKKYIDIHYIVNGAEKIKYSNIDDMQEKKEYNYETDFWLLKTDNKETGEVVVKEGYFVLCHTQDAHMPCLKVKGEKDSVRKVMIKVEA